MTNLNEVSDADSAANIYIDRLIIFLEGQSDIEIFARLFPNKQSEILFLTPDTPVGEISGQSARGCIAVIKRVSQERSDRPSDVDRVIGFVDRDIFFAQKKWDILFERDDQKYRDDSALGDGIMPLIYWEIENYLLDPEVVAIVLADLEKEKNEIRRNIHTAIDRSMYLNAANCIVHTHNVREIAHGIVLNECDESEFKALIEQQAKDKLGEKFSDDQLKEFYGRFCEFLDGLDMDARLERAMRIVPGKTLITYIVNCYGVHEKLERLLAKETRNSDKIHVHLIDDIEKRLVS